MNLPKTCHECNWQLPSLVLACPMCRQAVKGRRRIVAVYFGIAAGVGSLCAIFVLVATL